MNVATTATSQQRARDLPSVDTEVCASLAREFHVPARQVEAIYREELCRLAVVARINTFLGVLATRRVRTRLAWLNAADHGRESGRQSVAGS